MIVEENLIKITDFSPNWDYTKGGNKILICYDPIINLSK